MTQSGRDGVDDGTAPGSAPTSEPGSADDRWEISTPRFDDVDRNDTSSDDAGVVTRPDAAALGLTALEAALDELQERLDRSSPSSALGGPPPEPAPGAADTDGEASVAPGPELSEPARPELVEPDDRDESPVSEPAVPVAEDEPEPEPVAEVVEVESEPVSAAEAAAPEFGEVAPFDAEAAAFLDGLGNRPPRARPIHEGPPARRRGDGRIDWGAVVDAGASRPSTELAGPARSSDAGGAEGRPALDSAPSSASPTDAGRAETGDGFPAAADAGSPDVVAPAGDAVIDLREARPLPIARRPARPPRLQVPEPVGSATPDPRLRATASRTAADDRAAAARSTIATSLVAGGLRSDDLLVVDPVMADAVDSLAAWLPADVVEQLEARMLRTAAPGEPIPLALALGWLPFARRAARRVLTIVHHGELSAGPTWAGLDAVSQLSEAAVTVVVTIDPHELPRRDRPDLMVKRWARRFLDLGWRAVDLRHGGRHRGPGATTPEPADAAAVARGIADGSIGPGGNDLTDLAWLWDEVHRSSQPTVVFAYVAPTPSHGPALDAPSIAAIGGHLTLGGPPRPPSTFGLVRFDPVARGAESTEAAFLVGLEALLAESDELASRTALVSIGPRPVVTPSGASVIEVRDASSVATVVRAAHTLGHLPVVVGREQDLGSVSLALGQAIDEGTHVVLVGLASGAAASDPAAAARARRVPAIVGAVEGFELVEPFGPDWVEAELRDALHRIDTGDGSTYLRLGAAPAAPTDIDTARLVPALRRGGVVVRQAHAEPAAAVVTTGSGVGAALAAADSLAEQGIVVDVIALTAPHRLRRGTSTLDGRPGTSEVEQLLDFGRGHRVLVTVGDGVDLGWIAGVVGLRAVDVVGAGDAATRIEAATMAALDRVPTPG